MKKPLLIKYTNTKEKEWWLLQTRMCLPFIYIYNICLLSKEKAHQFCHSDYSCKDQNIDWFESWWK